MRIVFLCPSDDKPTGGVKVIYRHCEILNASGYDCEVMHPFDHTFRCSWFPHGARFATGPQLDRRSDFVIIPELWALPFAAQCRDLGVRYGIFVQNGYLTHAILPSHTRADLESVYHGADMILSISNDSTRMICSNYPSLKPDRIVDIRYSIGAHFAAVAPAVLVTRPRRVTFMPRKLADHAGRVVFALAGRLPAGWKLHPIQNACESDVVKILQNSSIFMSFSEFEGLPLPPLEAAIAGNLVIGYTGQGAQEYWALPNFIEIQQGDIIGFVDAVCTASVAFEAGVIDQPALHAGAETLAERFSPAKEAAGLARIANRIATLFHASSSGASQILEFV